MHSGARTSQRCEMARHEIQNRDNFLTQFLSCVFSHLRKMISHLSVKVNFSVNGSLIEKHFTAWKNDFTLVKLLQWRKGTFKSFHTSDSERCELLAARCELHCAEINFELSIW